jgi:hypothetical protein
MSRRPLHFITREKEWELIQRLQTIVNDSDFDPVTTGVIMASPDYSATVAMHLAHAWSRNGEMLTVIPIDVTYPGESDVPYRHKFINDFGYHAKRRLFNRLVLVEAGIIRGGNWQWMIEELHKFGYSRDDLTLVALCENIHSKVKSDYVGEYYDDDKEELMFYFEKYNKHWPIK